MKTTKIIRRSEALKRLASSRTPSGRLALCPCPYDTGKYKWEGSEEPYIGREQEVADDIDCLYVERRQDSDGAYCRVMCLTGRD